MMGSAASSRKEPEVSEETEECSQQAPKENFDESHSNKHSNFLLNENSKRKSAMKTVKLNQPSGKETRFVHSSTFPYKRAKLVPVRSRRTSGDRQSGNAAYSTSYSYNITGEVVQCNVMVLKNHEESV